MAARRFSALAAALLLLLAARAEPVGALPSPSPVKKDGPSTDPGRAKEIAALARRAGFAGELLVAEGDRVLLHEGFGPIAPAGGLKHRPGERWRLASITKQVIAALVVAKTAADLSRLDDPIGEQDADQGDRLSALGRLTVRQLLAHHTGLANPDESPADASGVPAFYTRGAPDIGYCLSRPARSGAAFSYNNCDYMFFGAARPAPVWPRGMAMARPNEVGVPGFVQGKPEPKFQLAAWGAAGGLIGTARAVFDFDRALMTGRLLPPDALAELWKPEGNGSAQALGQWVFPAPIRGCAAPVRIVQRDGEIYGVQARNFILPAAGIVVVLFTNRSSDDFPLGEVWQQRGFAYDLLSAAACPA